MKAGGPTIDALPKLMGDQKRGEIAQGLRNRVGSDARGNGRGGGQHRIDW